MSRSLLDYIQHILIEINLLKQRLEKVVEDEKLDEFSRLVLEQGGCSPEGYKFDRDAAHDRSN